MSDYLTFLERKAMKAPHRGLRDVPALAPHLFPFQSLCVDFALRAGASGLFLDTGLGKTECQLEWCHHAIYATGDRALILTPLAVAGQTKRRADRWGYEARVIREQSEAGSGINICNYDRLDKLDPDAFGIVSLDEASILKSFTGKTTRALIDAFRHCRFKLAATATPAPNDHMELGNYAEFLSVMAANEMLSRFFINDTSTASQEWRLKGHAVNAFWDWVSSWARAAEKPSDLGGDDTGFILPPFEVRRHRAADTKLDQELADMFGAPVLSAATMFDIKKQTSAARAKVAAQIVFDGIDEWTARLSPSGHEKPESKKTKSTLCDGQATPTEASIDRLPRPPTKSASESPSRPQTSNSDMPSGSAKTPKISTEPSITSETLRLPSWVLWCDTNDEQDHLERELGDLCISIRGSQSADDKERLHEAWIAGAKPVLVTKPSIFGFGCDWQHCANMIFVGRTFSYETYYQAVRRCWRFGQKRPVIVHIVVAEGEAEIGRIVDRKAADHDKMKRAMREAMRRATGQSETTKVPYLPTATTRLAPWIRSAA